VYILDSTALTLAIPLAPYDVVQSYFVLNLHLDSMKILPLWRWQPTTSTTHDTRQSLIIILRQHLTPMLQITF